MVCRAGRVSGPVGGEAAHAESDRGEPARSVHVQVVLHAIGVAAQVEGHGACLGLGRLAGEGGEQGAGSSRTEEGLGGVGVLGTGQ